MAGYFGYFTRGLVCLGSFWLGAGGLWRCLFLFGGYKILGGFGGGLLGCLFGGLVFLILWGCGFGDGG